MKRKLKHHPVYVTLPGGYKIEVQVLSKKEFNEENGEDDLATWDCSERVIYLRKARTSKQRLEDFVHELGHAYLDGGSWVLGNMKR